MNSPACSASFFPLSGIWYKIGPPHPFVFTNNIYHCFTCLKAVCKCNIFYTSYSKLALFIQHCDVRFTFADVGSFHSWILTAVWFPLGLDYSAFILYFLDVHSHSHFTPLPYALAHIPAVSFGTDMGGGSEAAPPWERSIYTNYLGFFLTGDLSLLPVNLFSHLCLQVWTIGMYLILWVIIQYY